MDKKFFTEKNLVKCLEEQKAEDVETVVDNIFNEVKIFEKGAEQFDDITLLAMRYLVDSTTDTTDVFHHIIPNQYSGISVLNKAFSSFSESHGITTEVRRQFNLVLDELLNNVISYAYDDDREHEIEIVCRYYKDRITLSISDDGIPFNPFVGEPPDTAVPLAERPIGGLGIHLVQSLMDKASYQRKVDKNIVNLVKYIVNVDSK